MQSRARGALLLMVAALLGACATPLPPASQPKTPKTPAPIRDEATAAAIERVLAGEHRSADNRARDVARHPLETLLFFGMTPTMTVVEVWPGAPHVFQLFDWLPESREAIGRIAQFFERNWNAGNEELLRASLG